MVFIKDTKDHDRRRAVISSTAGESRLVTHNAFRTGMLLSHRDVIHLTPLASPIQGDPSTLLDYKYFRLELDFPEAQTQASGPEVQTWRMPVMPVQILSRYLSLPPKWDA